ncbi:ShlB/FhaC/HecB family hemolysin secretion/activation protein [Aquabacterium sp. OR-4]|uniref:ShlB/FhaC/HecB family hemolysin secretion/activation protein n=1 Tax=Aquabacterium sp. OR-4 TaxID=2978127 RepID=UPI0028C827D9|nr:ShlB/FhaC/HecB family hemolysin secretion/activation protein [Aquabacterium sp. OR-4]MDT7834134.1 ShlB/FhaC/HecB family hemolysin secretion/activation protein [Aquabacterium sp. OR-4]
MLRQPQPAKPQALRMPRWPVAMACILVCAVGGAARVQAQTPSPTQAQATAAGASPAAEATVQVNGFWIEGNTLLDAGLIKTTLEPYRGQRSLSELKRAAEAVQALYGAAGFGAVVAYLPPQPVKDGVVTIAVLEGKLAKLTVQGHKRLSAERARAALPALVSGSTPRLQRIDRELQLANENPGRQLGVLLAPGAEPGQVEATLKVDEQAVTRWNLGLDNTGNERTGDWRVSLGWQHSDITGHDDVLSVQAQTSPTDPAKVKVLSGGYRLPLVSMLAALDLFGAYSNVDGGVQSTAAGGLRFAGKGRIAGARTQWYLPRLGEFDQRLSVGLEYRAYLNSCGIDGLPDGACGTAGQSVTVHPLTAEYSVQRSGALSAGASLGLAHNLGLGGKHGEAAAFDAVRPGAKRRYTVLRATANLSLPVFEDWALGGRMSAQLANDPLVPGEQFGIGGGASVRGYHERELSGDSGLQASLELSTPKLGWLGPDADLRLLGFVDAGQIDNQADTLCRPGKTRCTLSSAGVGLRLGWGPVQLRLAAAQAFDDAASTQRGDWRGHVSLGASF